MLMPPFEVVGCSWPRAVEHEGGRWLSEPEWEAPGMPYRPEPKLVPVGDEVCWLIDWREFLSRGRPSLAAGGVGEFGGCHVVVRLRMRETGRLAFFADDGCVIRRNGEIVHDDRETHALTRHEIGVEEGDLLEVAQWQAGGEWKWGAFLESEPATADRIAATFLPYLPFVEARLTQPEGPPLKVFTNAASPARTILAVYSLILNGFTPSEVLLYGSHQWREPARHLMEAAFPFARIVPLEEVEAGLAAAGGDRIATWARKPGFIMKAAVLLFAPPAEFCCLDDDVFVLGRLDDALAAFATHDVVYGQDFDQGADYLSIWRGIVPDCPEPLPTGRLNAGFMWLRNRYDPRRLAEWMQRAELGSLTQTWYGEQGFIAVVFARQAHALSRRRYLIPAVDGLPGGVVGYDYRANPCGYASVHFAGPWAKPTDREALLLAPEILGDPETGGFSPVI
jgi:hypothetical protein